MCLPFRLNIGLFVLKRSLAPLFDVSASQAVEACTMIES